MILVGDVGGTKTLLEIGILQGGRWQPAHGGRYAAADYPDMDGLLRNFLGEWKSLNHSHGTILHACLGVAGPVLDDCAQMTNLPWTVDGKAISASFGIPRVQVVNDFAAAASGIELLLKSDVIVLQTGEPMHGAPRLVIGAGTGLGVAQLVWTGAGYQVLSGEAGHAGFAPASLEQSELWHDLFARHSRVTAEDVVSGPGLMRVYEHVLRKEGCASTVASASPAAILHGALVTGDGPCLRALDLFIECYGEVAGNLALGILARGGVYVAGGLAPRMVSRLMKGGFLAAFNDKGTHSNSMRKIPVSIVTNERLGLLGCALIATSSPGGQ